MTSDAGVEERARILRFHGSKDKIVFEQIGFNSRLDELQAAVLLELAPLVDGWNRQRADVAARYAELGLGELVELPYAAPGRDAHLPPVRRAHAASRRAGRVRSASAASAPPCTTGTRCTCSRSSRTSATARARCPVTEQAARDGLALPMFPTLEAAQQAEVVDAVRAASAVAA